jgi:biotin carboxyl carrier protein
VKFEMEIGNRVRTVEIQRRSDGYHVSVDGRLRIVDAARVAEDGWSLLLREPDGSAIKSVEASVRSERGNGGFDVHIDGFDIPVQLKGGLGRRTRDVSGAGKGVGPQRVVAPMPGKVTRVLVKPGDDVKPRQCLGVVEAMKMENELRAAREGRVREVLVAPGQSVDAGAPLVIVE